MRWMGHCHQVILPRSNRDRLGDNNYPAKEEVILLININSMTNIDKVDLDVS